LTWKNWNFKQLTVKQFFDHFLLWVFLFEYLRYSVPLYYDFQKNVLSRSCDTSNKLFLAKKTMFQCYLPPHHIHVTYESWFQKQNRKIVYLSLRYKIFYLQQELYCEVWNTECDVSKSRFVCATNQWKWSIYGAKYGMIVLVFVVNYGRKYVSVKLDPKL
jgi:hypothetical protein